MIKQKRRNFFIKKNLQGKLILGYFLFVLSGCLFFILLMGVFTSDTMTISYTGNDLEMGITPVMLLKKTLAGNWIFLFLGSLCLVYSAMRVTHRVAGPLFRLEKALDNMLEGNLADFVVLRKKDEGQKLAEKLNRFNGELSESVRRVSSESQAIKELLAKAQEKTEGLPEEQRDELKSILWSIEEKEKKISRTCLKYIPKND